MIMVRGTSTSLVVDMDPPPPAISARMDVIPSSLLNMAWPPGGMLGIAPGNK